MSLTGQKHETKTKESGKDQCPHGDVTNKKDFFYLLGKSVNFHLPTWYPPVKRADLLISKVGRQKPRSCRREAAVIYVRLTQQPQVENKNERLIALTLLFRGIVDHGRTLFMYGSVGCIDRLLYLVTLIF